MNLTFLPVMVALTGLLGLAFALFGALTSKRGRGKPGKLQPISLVGDLLLLLPRRPSITVLPSGVI